MPQLQSTPIAIERLDSSERLDAAFAAGLVEVYRDVFAESPSCHDSPLERIQRMWQQHYESDSKILIAKDLGKAIAFAATVPFPRAYLNGTTAVTDGGETVTIDEKLCGDRLGIDPFQAWYLADIGTHRAYRARGIATALWRETLCWLPEDAPIVLRVTQAKQNAVRLYQSWGFELVGLSQYPQYKKINGHLEIEPKHVMVYYRK
jgi:ribosomal protein S18 acetylase RimI-like enzyme